jgi:hypothetical protein
LSLSGDWEIVCEGLTNSYMFVFDGLHLICESWEKKRKKKVSSLLGLHEKTIAKILVIRKTRIVPHGMKRTHRGIFGEENASEGGNFPAALSARISGMPFRRKPVCAFLERLLMMVKQQI